MRRAGKLALFASLTALAACGGGGGGGGASTPAVPPAPPAVTTQNVTFNIAIPQYDSAARRPRYVSPSTGWITVTASPVAGGTPASAAGACGNSCTITISAPVGSDLFSLSLYDRQGGNLLSTGSATYTVVANVTNTVNVAVGGIVAKLVPANVPFMFKSGTAGSGQEEVQAFDADGNQIIGTAAPSGPVATVSSSSSHITVTPAASSGVWPFVYTVAYDGGAVGGTATITTTAPGITATTTPVYLATSGVIVAPKHPTSTLIGLRSWPEGYAVSNGVVGYADTLMGEGFISSLAISHGHTYAIGAVFTNPGLPAVTDQFITRDGSSGVFMTAGSHDSLALDSAGLVYAGITGYGIDVFPATSFAAGSSPVPPSYTITTAIPPFAIDGKDTLYAFVPAAAGIAPNIIGVFPKGSYGAAAAVPASTIVLPPGTYTGIGVNPAGDVAVIGSVGGTMEILIVPAGQLAPTRTIAGSATLLNSSAAGVGIDPSGAVYTAVWSGVPSSCCGPNILGFTPSANGNVAPANVVPAAGLYDPDATVVVAVGPLS